MTKTVNLSAETWQRLKERAEQSGASADALLNRLLDQTSSALPPVYHFAEYERHEVLQKRLNNVLEVITSNQSLTDILTLLIDTIEKHQPGLMGSILLLDAATGQLRHGAGPSLPEAYNAEVDGIVSGSGVGSCGTAATEKRLVIVEDIEIDPLWKDYRELAAAHGLRACWSHPIVNQDGDVLGTFGLYYRQPRTPTQDEIELIQTAAHIAGTAIQHKRAEDALRESEARYKMLTELMSDYAASIYVNADMSFNVEWVVGAFARITGYTPDERPDWSTLVLIHPDDEARVNVDLQRTLAGEPSTSEYRIRHKSGVYRWIHVQRQPVWDAEAGRVVRFFSAVKDITEQKQADNIKIEQERLKARLQKEKELNTLIQRAVSSLAHDIRTPLAVIKSSRDILSRYFDRMDEDKRREKLATIDRQLAYVIQLMDDLSMEVQSGLSYRHFQPSAVNIVTLCLLSVEEIRDVNDAAPTLTFVNRTHIESIEADETLITRILLNLLSNAVKYSASNGTIRLELDQQDDDWLIIRVADDGIGINAEDLPHIFEPFYRVRSAAVMKVGGTGLGLSIVKDCVERHKGEIRVESEPGRGTTITVMLPIIHHPD